MCGLCGTTDRHLVEGIQAHHPRENYPAVLGHEASGVVERVGEGVSYVQPGDRVIMSFRPFCGSCYYCLSGRPNLCNDPTQQQLGASRLTWKGQPILQFANVGSFSELMVTTETGVVKIPEEMPMAEAALIGCGVMTEGPRLVVRRAFGKRPPRRSASRCSRQEAGPRHGSS